MSPQTADQIPGPTDQYMQGIPQASGSDTSLSDAVLILRKRKWILLATTVLGLLAGFYRLSTQPKLF